MARLTPASLRHRLLCRTSRHACPNHARPVSSASTRPKALKAKPNNGLEFEMPQITFYEQDENMKSPPRRVGAISTLEELKRHQAELEALEDEEEAELNSRDPVSRMKALKGLMNDSEMRDLHPQIQQMQRELDPDAPELRKGFDKQEEFLDKKLKLDVLESLIEDPEMRQYRDVFRELQDEIRSGKLKAGDEELVLSDPTMLSDSTDTITDFKNADSEGLKAMLEAVEGKMDYSDKDGVAASFDSEMQKMIEDFEDETLEETLNDEELKSKLLEIVEGNGEDKNLEETLNDRNQPDAELSGARDISQTPAPSVLPIKERIVTAEADPEHKFALQRLVIDLPRPHSSNPRLKQLNEVLRTAYMGANEDIRKALWRAYTRAKAGVPGLLERIPDDAWDMLWYSQAVKWSSNSNREEHLRILSYDLKTVGRNGPPTKQPA